MDFPAQVLIADLPRGGDLIDRSSNGRPTTLVRSEKEPKPEQLNPSVVVTDVASVDAQLTKLNESLAALETEAHSALHGAVVDECQAGLEAVEELLVGLAERASKRTFWQKCFPCKGWKKRDLLRRHVGVVQDTYETVGKTHQRVGLALAELCGKADRLGEDAKKLADTIGQAKIALDQKRETHDALFKDVEQKLSSKMLQRTVLCWQEKSLKAEMEWAEAQLCAMSGNDAPCRGGHGHDDGDGDVSLITSEQAAVAGMRFEIKQIADLLSTLTCYSRMLTADSWTIGWELKRLREDCGAKDGNIDGVRLETMSASMESVFRVKHEGVSTDLRRQHGALREAQKRCLSAAARLEKLRESNFGDLVVGLSDLANLGAKKQTGKKLGLERCKLLKKGKPIKFPHASHHGLTLLAYN
ncbi:hypothetical protein CORC01_07620 [Colletotrichum orchidophilum]|uniref:Uncharacterized protein n=1 Tax=Colletotrichum orchidophilum TaxID=1209926 RepID=A0A1G4B6G6_9PEZI|nr:uncharacterized protein CORC01_07620 [Colletotrichum orchidophilum]OHE97011.1 hypothetical protein CORC01_07620 [Colletotrichum orchidophilum]